MRRAAVLRALLLATLCPPPAAASDSLNGAVILGYQGWFRCDAAQSPNRWAHWFARGADGQPAPVTDLLPDVTGLPPEARCPLPSPARDGAPAEVYDSRHPAVADRHLALMAAHGIAGVAAQRFIRTLERPETLADFDRVLTNLRAAAERHRRSVFVMYDLSGGSPEAAGRLVADWRRLAAGPARERTWQRHHGRPVLGLWGVGLPRAGLTPAQTLDLFRDLRAAGPVTILCGVPVDWRVANQQAWVPVWPGCDVISPWTVGRNRDEAGADRYAPILRADIAAARGFGRDLMPVAYPGFTWTNLMRLRGREVPAHEIPRRCGAFLRRQLTNAVNAGAATLYVAMADEVDEGTAILPVVTDPARVPEGYATPDPGPCRMPPDGYLRIVGEAAAALRAARPR